MGSYLESTYVSTPWCSGMVPVPKKSGAVRICVDLKSLNESVLQEVFPLPTVDRSNHVQPFGRQQQGLADKSLSKITSTDHIYYPL